MHGKKGRKPKPEPQRGEKNTTISFSLPKAMKDRIKELAEKEHRTVANWLVKELEPIVEARMREQIKNEHKNPSLAR